MDQQEVASPTPKPNHGYYQDVMSVERNPTCSRLRDPCTSCLACITRATQGWSEFFVPIMVCPRLRSLQFSGERPGLFLFSSLLNGGTQWSNVQQLALIACYMVSLKGDLSSEFLCCLEIFIILLTHSYIHILGHSLYVCLLVSYSFIHPPTFRHNHINTPLRRCKLLVWFGHVYDGGGIVRSLAVFWALLLFAIYRSAWTA